MSRRSPLDGQAYFIGEDYVKRLDWLLSWLEATHTSLEPETREMLAKELRALIYVVKESPLMPAVPVGEA